VSNQALALIVIDESEVRERVARELARADCLVYACSRFEQGRDVLDRMRPDILIAGVRLQEYNGLSLVLRANAHCPRTTTIIYTSHDDPVLRREAHRNGAAFVGDAGLSEALRSSLAV
jgi:DNA-binding NtrC family response regulator